VLSLRLGALLRDDALLGLMLRYPPKLTGAVMTSFLAVAANQSISYKARAPEI